MVGKIVTLTIEMPIRTCIGSVWRPSGTARASAGSSERTTLGWKNLIAVRRKTTIAAATARARSAALPPVRKASHSMAMLSDATVENQRGRRSPAVDRLMTA